MTFTERIAHRRKWGVWVWIVALLILCAIPLHALRPPMDRYVISSGIGYRTNPMGGGEQSFHEGIDMVGPHGSAILAAGDGLVVEHWPAPGTLGKGGRIFRGHPVFGAKIVIDHGNGVWTVYGHMARTFIHEGQRVKAGQIIGIQGATGDATGEHLHFECKIDPRLLFGSSRPALTYPIGLPLRDPLELLK